MWFFIFSGFLAYTGKPVSSSCPIEISPPRAVVRIGDRFSTNCTTSSDQVKEMGWESSNGGTSLTQGVSFLLLNIDSVTDWQLEPLCFVNLMNGNQCSQNLSVTVYKTPDSVSLSQPGQIGPMTEGENYRMQCDIVDVAPIRELSVRWHRGNEIFCTETFDEFSVYPVNVSSVCNLTARRDDNGAEIWCEATLSLGTSGPNHPSIKSQPLAVIVLYPPTFANPAHETLELQADSKLTLNCTAAGNPTPVYSWHSPNPPQLMKENQDINQAILTPSNEGTYNCKASNSQGTRTKHFTITRAPRSHYWTIPGFVMFLIVILILAFWCKRNSSVAEGLNS